MPFFLHDTPFGIRTLESTGQFFASTKIFCEAIALPYPNLFPFINMHEHESIPPSTSLLEVSSCYPPEQDGPIDCDASSAVRTGERGRSPVQVPSLFVSRLYEMLRDCELDKSKGDIVSWLPDGKSFRVHKPKEVIKDILPAYFSQVRLLIFQYRFQT